MRSGHAPARHWVGHASVALVVARWSCAAPASAQKLRQPSATSALKQLVSQTNKLPSSAATKKQKAKLKRAAAAARRSARKAPVHVGHASSATSAASLRGIKVKKGRRNREAPTGCARSARRR